MHLAPHRKHARPWYATYALRFIWPRSRLWQSVKKTFSRLVQNNNYPLKISTPLWIPAPEMHTTLSSRKRRRLCQCRGGKGRVHGRVGEVNIKREGQAKARQKISIPSFFSFRHSSRRKETVLLIIRVYDWTTTLTELLFVFLLQTYIQERRPDQIIPVIKCGAHIPSKRHT